MRKNDIIERLIGINKIGATRKTVCDDDDPETLSSLSYLTEDVKCVLNDLPVFLSATQWEKQLKGVLNDFTLMNLLIHLV